ncbi:MAG: YdeI/OmpD-associated family protein [Labilithrix sp.]|nr:YdeI/OmpD-associated family protein [Labilithrix sp.]
MDRLVLSGPAMNSLTSAIPLIRLARPIVGIDDELPEELQEALAAQPELRVVFDDLSELRRRAYIDWIAGARTEADRHEHAHLVCTVLRLLSSPESTPFDPWATPRD